MKGFNKLISVLLGLLLIAVIGLAVVSTTGLKTFPNLDLKYTYIDTLPAWISWGNLIIVYGIVLLKLIVIFALLKGTKKSARVIILPLLIIAGDLVYRNLAIFKGFYNTVFASLVLKDIFDAVLNYGLINLLEFATYAFVVLFVLFYVIVALVGRTHKIGARITLLILGILPVALIYGAYLKQGIYIPAKSEIANYGVEFGIYVLLGFVTCITHFDKGKYERKRRKMDKFTHPTLPLDKLTK